MRAWIVPLVALGAVVVSANDEPSERQMRLAFEDTLVLQVQNALDFAQEAGGEEAVLRIRQNGTDRFTVNAFEKLRCQPEPGRSNYICDFRVDIDLVNGALQRTLTGRFHSGPQGLVFADKV